MNTHKIEIKFRCKGYLLSDGIISFDDVKVKIKEADETFIIPFTSIKYMRMQNKQDASKHEKNSCEYAQL
jgi:hypothetical protein